MLRIFVFVFVVFVGVYFYEQYSGKSYGVAETVHSLSAAAKEATGIGQLGGGSASGYGMATGVGQSMSSGTRSLGASIGSSLKAAGGI